jgi:hypothetical protein
MHVTEFDRIHPLYYSFLFPLFTLLQKKKKLGYIISFSYKHILCFDHLPPYHLLLLSSAFHRFPPLFKHVMFLGLESMYEKTSNIFLHLAYFANMMTSSSIHFPENDTISFFMANTPLHVYVCMCMYVYIYIHTHIYKHTHTHTHTHTHIYMLHFLYPFIS